MARRKVTHAQKGRGGRITGVAGPSFGFLPAQVVAEGIRSGSHTYLVREAPFETEVRVVEEEGQYTLTVELDLLDQIPESNETDNTDSREQFFETQHLSYFKKC